MMKKHLLTIALLGLLVACSSPQERAAVRAQREADACTKQGFTPDTPEFEDCRLQVRDMAEQRKSDRMGAFDGLQQLQSNHH